jgi:hypothetical protein
MNENGAGQKAELSRIIDQVTSDDKAALLRFAYWLRDGNTPPEADDDAGVAELARAMGVTPDFAREVLKGVAR